MGGEVRFTQEWKGRRIWTNRGKKRALEGLQAALENILTESNRLVPLDEGTLERSGRVQIDEQAMRGIVSYDTPYAMRQHEELSWNHAPGRQAKYLETALNNNQEKTMEIMRKALSIWTRGG